MDLTSTDILFGLGAVAAAVVVASAVYVLSGRVTRPDGPASPGSAPSSAGWTDETTAAWVENMTTTPDAGADAHGRHRAPEELLRASTYRLSADRVARAKVRDQSQAIPSPSRSRS